MSFHLVVRPEVDVDRFFLEAVSVAMARLADDALLYRIRHRRMKVLGRILAAFRIGLSSA